MASRSSVVLQTVVKCDKCHGTNKVSSFCITCVGNLCDKCKQDHVTDNFTARHRVLPRGHPLVMKARRQDRKPCPDHAGEEYVSYCNKCKCFCCVKCMTTTHREHPADTIEDAGEQVLLGLTVFMEQFENDVVQKIAKDRKNIEKYPGTKEKWVQWSKRASMISKKELLFSEHNFRRWKTTRKGK